MLNSNERENHLKNFKMPTVVGILIFICMISKASESLIARKVLYFSHFSYYGQLKFKLS